MKRLFVTFVLLSGMTQPSFALEKDQFIGNWKMTGYKCASGKTINLGTADVEYAKYNISLDVLSGDRATAKIELSFAFKPSKIAELLKNHYRVLAEYQSAKPTPKVLASIDAITKSREEALVMLAPRTCTNIQSMTYYIRGNTFYTNDISNISNCNNPDGGDNKREFELEHSTLAINGDTLIVTGGTEVVKNSVCEIGDRTEMIFARE